VSFGIHAPRSSQCAVCLKPYLVLRMGQKVCGAVCARKFAKSVKAKGAKELRARKEVLKPVSQWEDECRRIVQKIARLRDRNDGCISCHMGPNYGGQWHGSHYRSVGASSNTQFLLWNIHKACAQCNKFKGGNREFYRPAPDREDRPRARGVAGRTEPSHQAQRPGLHRIPQALQGRDGQAPASDGKTTGDGMRLCTADRWARSRWSRPATSESPVRRSPRCQRNWASALHGCPKSAEARHGKSFAHRRFPDWVPSRMEKRVEEE
jgi:hypothetical protein